MRYVYMALLLAVCLSCTGQKKNESTIENQEKPLTFRMVFVPDILTQPSDRAAYLVEHYWDNFDFSDLRYTDAPHITEQAFVDYIEILSHTDYKTAYNSIQGMLRKAEADSTMFSYFTELYDKYLHDPNSPFRNEEFYIPVLETIIESFVIDDVMKIRPLSLLELALQNRVGENANDFTYILANGKKATMYSVISPYLLIYFYNPDCHTCKEVTAQLASSSLITKAILDGQLKILAVYPDEDLTAWKEHLEHMPATWINSYNENEKVKNEEIYDLKAIPTLYLLDKDKKVLLKDSTFEQLVYFLQQI